MTRISQTAKTSVVYSAKKETVELIRIKLKFHKVIEDLTARDWKCMMSRNAFWTNQNFVMRRFSREIMAFNLENGRIMESGK